jgi:hypothetical protein
MHDVACIAASINVNVLIPILVGEVTLGGGS